MNTFNYIDEYKYYLTSCMYFIDQNLLTAFILTVLDPIIASTSQVILSGMSPYGARLNKRD